MTLDMEAVKTAFAACGVYAVTYLLMRVILWLDKPRRDKGND